MKFRTRLLYALYEDLTKLFFVYSINFSPVKDYLGNLDLLRPTMFGNPPPTPGGQASRWTYRTRMCKISGFVS